ncbi:hypothetical protein Trydic_g8194 [Trypoxylus dichotomus]
MLSLVAYGNSDSEDENSSNKSERNDSENNKNSGAVEIVTKADEGEVTSIFESLPQPQINEHDDVAEEDDEYLKKKEIPIEKPKKQPIKISVPSLTEFDSDDDDETPSKKPKLSSKSCGLFALLPAPKTTLTTTKHFVPNAVKKNINKNIKPSKKIVPVTVANKSEDHLENVDSENDDDDMKNLPDTFDDEIWQKVCGRKQKHVKIPVSEASLENKIIIQPDPDVKKPYEGLDNQAFKELIGANKRKVEAVDIVEIAEDEILCDKKIWMTKSLTDPEMAPKYIVKDPVNDTCKRKHHITYLAQQAKANEQELQNQWAQSRFTRQKTQAKYGF